MNELDTAYLIQDLNKKIDAIYRHGTLQERYSAIPKDYGEGFILTEAEAHVLGFVCEMKEATVTALAEYSFRSKGSMSKMLKHLEEKGLVQRTKKGGNNKSVYILPTGEGLCANEIHRAYDQEATSVMLRELLTQCSMEEVESFYKVTQARIEFLKKIPFDA